LLAERRFDKLDIVRIDAAREPRCRACQRTIKRAADVRHGLTSP
jgi:coenzyme F420-reducing hydrogenase beta subunit